MSQSAGKRSTAKAISVSDQILDYRAHASSFSHVIYFIYFSLGVRL